MRLGVDVQNKGLSGSCHIESTAAEFIACGCEWDFATLELGVNMRATFTPEEFEKRARHIVARCTGAKPGRPVVLITIFQNAAHRLIEPDAVTGRQEAFNQILRGIARECQSRDVHIIEGADIVDDLGCLGTDLVHPSDYGHARMGENLARALSPLIAAISNPRPPRVTQPSDKVVA
jgi:lysophospholipase L1-like esterase